MSVTKRLRYEVLKRDNHACRYCGATAPDAKLTVDHVTPVALGGTDDPANLVAACRDCNYGKSSTSPDADMIQQVGEDAIRWATAVRAASELMEKDLERQSARHEWFLSEWKAWDDAQQYLPHGYAKSLDHWVGAGLSHPVMIDCLDIALGNRGIAHEAVFAYMGGIARKRIEELHASARALLDAEADDGA